MASVGKSIIGLDLSLTSSGYAVLYNGNLGEHGTINPKTKGVPRLLEIETAIGKLITAEEFSERLGLVVLEGYAFARPNQAHQIGELGGVVRRLLHQWQNLRQFQPWSWIEVAPAAVKKFATGKGNAQKDVILQQVYKRWGVEFGISDEADAFVLAKVGEALLGSREGLTAFQLEVLTELEKKGKKLREVG